MYSNEITQEKGFAGTVFTTSSHKCHTKPDQQPSCWTMTKRAVDICGVRCEYLSSNKVNGGFLVVGS